MTLAPELPAGARIGGKFVIQRLAGRGGMGAVYRAVDETTGEPVALKILEDQNEASFERFAREAEVLAKLDHPAIVRYVASGEAGAGVAWLAMQWLDGEDLAERLEREGLRVAESVTLAARLADALASAHAAGVVHRDIKPSNVFLPAGRVEDAVLLDFGIARPLGARSALTRTGMLMGTPGYMAPEQLEGRTDIDARADVFSLGSLLFECLTGRPAFPGEHLMAVLARVLLEEAPSVDRFRSDVPDELTALVARMLSKTPADRPADGRAVAGELAALSLTKGTRAPPRPARPAITGSEQRLLSVVVALPATSAEGRRDATIGVGLTKATVDEVRASVRIFGARVDEVADALLVSLSGATSPADGAAHAARAALVVQEILRGASIAVVTSRGEASGGGSLGVVVERAAELLDEAPIAGDDRAPAIWVDDVTRALLDARFEVVETNRGGILVAERGVAEDSRSLLGRPSPCVGRERELGTLLGLVEEAMDEERARAVLVTGPPGIGKSRIRHELVRRLAQRSPPLSIAIGRGDTIHKESSFWLIGSLLRHAAGIAGSEPLEVRREKLVSLVSFVRADERARVAGILGEITGCPFPEETTPLLRAARLDGAVMATEVRRAFIDLLAAACAARPLCLVFEDLHWADASSVALLDRALGMLSDEPLCIVALARREVFEGWPKLFSERTMDELRLGQLGRRAVEKLVRSALGDAIDPAIVARIVDRAGGNPFCVEELVRAVAEGRSESLPETVLGMVEARLSALPPHERRLLRAASIFGEVFWASGAASMSFGDRRPSSNDDPWESLVACEVLSPRETSRFSGETELAFRHALVREGAYAMLTEADRALGHRLAAEWLEGVGETDPVVLAEHFERSDEPRRAAPHFSKAAEAMLRAGEYFTAIRLAERGLACGAEGQLEAELYMWLAEALVFSGNFTRSLELVQKSVERATPGSRIHALAIGGYVATAFMAGDAGPLVASIPILATVEPTAEARGMFAWAMVLVTLSLVYATRIELVTMFLGKLERLANEEGGDSVTRAWWLHGCAIFSWLAKGDAFGAMKSRRRAVDILERAGHVHHATFVRSALPGELVALGAYERAEELIAALRRSSDDIFAITVSEVSRVQAALQQGELDRAAATARAVLEHPFGGKLYKGEMCAASSEIHLAKGDLDEAERYVGLAKSVFIPEHYVRVRLSMVESGIALARGDAPLALSFADEALAFAASRGVQTPYCPQARLARARALIALGRPDEARATIAEARAKLLSLAAQSDDETLAKSFLERVPTNAAILALAGELSV